VVRAMAVSERRFEIEQGYGRRWGWPVLCLTGLEFILFSNLSLLWVLHAARSLLYRVSTCAR